MVEMPLGLFTLINTMIDEIKDIQYFIDKEKEYIYQSIKMMVRCLRKVLV